MPRSSSYIETEIKLRLKSAGVARRLLRRLGFEIHTRRVFENNIVFDTPDLAIRRKSNLLRLRLVGSQSILTFKGAPASGRHKARVEIETEISDPEALMAIFAGLGYQPAFRYEKYRTEYRKPGRSALVLLDETPIGDFLEIEASARSIDRTARELGYSVDDYITASYGRLYLDHCQSIGATPGNMVFTGRN